MTEEALEEFWERMHKLAKEMDEKGYAWDTFKTEEIIEMLDNPPAPSQGLIDLLACEEHTDLDSGCSISEEYLNWEEQEFEQGRMMYENGFEWLEELPEREKK